MRGRALVGAGAWNDSYGSVLYNLGDVGGERFHQLSITELPTHNFSFAIQIPLYGNNDSQGVYPVGGDFWGTNFGSYNANGITNTVGGNQPHNNMQPYMAIYYIMKI